MMRFIAPLGTAAPRCAIVPARPGVPATTQRV